MVAFRIVYHWLPDCPLWPLDENQDLDPNRVHAIARTPAGVNCPHCQHDPDVRPADQPKDVTDSP